MESPDSFILSIQRSQGLLGLAHLHQTPWSECQSCQRLRFDFLLKVLPKAFLAVVFEKLNHALLLSSLCLKVSRFWAACGRAEDRGFVGRICFVQKTTGQSHPVSSSLPVGNNMFVKVMPWGGKKRSGFAIAILP